MRVFIAVDIDNPAIVSRLRDLEASLLATRVPMKPVEPENFHITIRFIGEVPDYVVNEIRSQVLPKIKFKPFVVKLAGVGAFPSPSNARVVWIGIQKGFEELKAIRDQVDKLLTDLGLRLEQEEFAPHITLARIKDRGNPAIYKFIMDNANVEVGEQEVRSVRLKKSTLTPRGPIYETLAEASTG